MDELRSRAQDALLTKAIATEQQLDGNSPSAELLAMEEVTDEMGISMASHGILTVDDLADQSIDELMVVDDMDEELAARLIMKARESWFSESEEETTSETNAEPQQSAENAAAGQANA